MTAPRSPTVLPAALLVVVLALAGALSACSGSGSPSSDDAPTFSPAPRATDGGSGASGGASSSPTAGPDTTRADVCVEVRAGIDAFNEAIRSGDFTDVVKHFEAAVPLAQAAAKAHPSTSADRLLEAVRYYAHLAPEDYLVASQTSADFEKYKQITLGQCESDGSGGSGSGDGGGVAI